MVEAPVGGHLALQLILAGVTKGRMTQVMTEGQGLGEVGIQIQRHGQGAGDLRHLQGMGQTGAIVISFMSDKDLGLLLEAPEGGGVDDAVPVPGEGRAGRTIAFREQPPARAGWILSPGHPARHAGRRHYERPTPDLFASRHISPHIEVNRDCHRDD